MQFDKRNVYSLKAKDVWLTRAMVKLKGTSP